MGLFDAFKKKKEPEINMDAIQFNETECWLNGSDWKCQFPTDQFKKRQEVLATLAKTDQVHLKAFQSGGKTYFAVIADRAGADIGVIPSDEVEHIEKFCGKIHGLVGKIQHIRYGSPAYDPEKPERYTCLVRFHK